jgi:probable selenate reductase FAD-binding subunit
MRLKEYHKPATIDEALELLRRDIPRTTVLSGGTWLNAEGSNEFEAVIDINNLGLDKIVRTSTPPLIRIGAAVTLQTLVEELKGLPGLDVISKAAHAMAALNIRNQATIGGVIVTADSASPLVTALLICDAELIVKAAENRTVSLSAFLSYRERITAEKVLITAIQMPVPTADTVAVYHRVARTPRDYPIVCVAARCAVKEGIVGNMRVAIGGVAPTPIRLNMLEFALEKKLATSALEDALNDEITRLSPQGDWLGSAEYRLNMARVLVRRAIMEAARIQ